MTVSRLPNARYRDVILRLDLETARLLSMAASRENVDVEIIAAHCIEKFYSPDGRSKSERQRAQATEAQAQLQRHHKSLGLANAGGFVSLSGTPDNESEIDRLARLANDG